MSKILIKGNLLVTGSCGGNLTALANEDDVEGAIVIEGDVTIDGNLSVEGDNEIKATGGISCLK